MKNKTIDNIITRREKNLQKTKKTNKKIILDICGGSTPYSDGINNIDISKNKKVDFVMDISKAIEFPDCSVDEIISIGTLEHFQKKDFYFVLYEMIRVLKINGVIKISTPDIEKITKFVSKHGFLKNIDLVNQYIFGLQQDKYDIHLIGLSAKFFKKLLINSGFEKINTNDTNFYTRHDKRLMCFVTATKKRNEIPIDFLSEYKIENNLLTLNQSDKICLSNKQKSLNLFLPEYSKLNNQFLTIYLNQSIIHKQKIFFGNNIIKIKPVKSIKFYLLELKFSDYFVPKKININNDERKISAFLITNSKLKTNRIIKHIMELLR